MKQKSGRLSNLLQTSITIGIFVMSTALAFGQSQYDLLLQGGHVIDAKNKISGIRDVAVKDGKIAAVAEHIDPAKAFKVINVKDLYVTPGLIDIHVHVYASTGEAHSYAGDNGVWPDGFTFRSGVTTVADAGSSGYRISKISRCTSSIARKRECWHS